MRFIPPLEITPARLTSTSAVEIYANYNPATTYAVDDIVFDPITDKTYKSLKDENLNNPLDGLPIWTFLGKAAYFPPAFFITGTTYAINELIQPDTIIGGDPFKVYKSKKNGNTDSFTVSASWQRQPDTYPLYRNYSYYGANETVIFSDLGIYQSRFAANPEQPPTTPKAWEAVGPSNKLAMFNLRTSVRTIAASPLVVVITPGQRVDSIDLSGMVNVKTVRVQITSGGTPVYDQSVNMVKRNIKNWTDFFFKPFQYKKSITKFDLPQFLNSVITVTFTSPASNVEVGSLVVGQQVYVGAYQYGAERGYTNYSSVVRDFDGGVNTLTQRPAIPKISGQVWMDKADVQAISELLLAVDATPIVISGIDDATDGYFEPVHMVGLIKDAPISLQHPLHAIMSLTAESVSSK